jgi:hypothetical protein
MGIMLLYPGISSEERRKLVEGDIRTGVFVWVTRYFLWGKGWRGRVYLPCKPNIGH